MTDADHSQLEQKQAEPSIDDHEAKQVPGPKGHWSQYSIAGLIVVQTVSAVIFAIGSIVGVALVVAWLVFAGFLLTAILGTVLVCKNFQQVGISYNRYERIVMKYAVAAICTFAALSLLAFLWGRN